MTAKTPTRPASPSKAVATDLARPAIGPIADAAARQASRAADMAAAWWAQGGDKCRTAADRLRREARAAGEGTRSYVRAEPGKSLLFAAAAGALLAGLLGSALKRER